jgi:hypothetical protein
MVVKEPADYPEPEEDNPLREPHLLDHKRHENPLCSAPSPQNAVLCCPLPGQLCY